MKIKTALIVFNVAFWALLILMFLATIFAGLGPVLNYYVYAPLTFIFVIVTTFIVYRKDPPPATETDEKEANAVEEGLPPTPPRKKERIEWIDDLKVLLICLVVVGHSAVSIMGFGAFLTLGTIPADPDNTNVVPVAQTTYYDAVFWSCFFLLKPAIVPLFFFVSGFFSGMSRQKYGRSGFLKKTFMRLGPPALLFWLVVNPLNSYLGYALVKPEGMTYAYSPGQAATWFLTWLMVFNCCYAYMDIEGLDGSMEVPTFGKVVKIGLIVGLMQGVAGILGILSGGSFAEMPLLPIGDGYFNALGYATGILAFTNGWLNKDYQVDKGLIKKSKIYVICASLLTIILCFACYAPTSPINEGVIGVPGLGVLVLSVGLFLPLGPYCPSVWIVILNAFRGDTSVAADETAKGRKCPALFKFMSGAAFAVFLFHYFFVTLYTYSFIEILDVTQGIDIKFVNSTATADTALGNGNEFAGFAFVATLSLVSAFLFGGLLKMIPGVGNFM